jgi:hypothetical protein
MDPQNTFPDIQVQCTDGIVNTHRLTLVSISDYFAKYYTNDKFAAIDVVEIPQIGFSCSALNKVLLHAFYRFIPDHRVTIEQEASGICVPYAEIPEIVGCAEFLLIPESEICDLVSDLLCEATGEYVDTVTPVIINHATNLGDRVLRSMSNKDIVVLILSKTHRTYVLKRIIRVASSDRCFTIYTDLDYYNILDTDTNDDTYYCDFVKHVSQSDQFVFADFKRIYEHMIGLLVVKSNRFKTAWNTVMYLYKSYDFEDGGLEYVGICNVIEVLLGH